MSAYTIVTAEERERFDGLQTAMKRADGPKFLEYDHRVAQYWQLLAETFPQYQFGLVEKKAAKQSALVVAFPSPTTAHGTICLPKDLTGFWNKDFEITQKIAYQT